MWLNRHICCEAIYHRDRRNRRRKKTKHTGAEEEPLYLLEDRTNAGSLNFISKLESMQPCCQLKQKSNKTGKVCNCTKKHKAFPQDVSTQPVVSVFQIQTTLCMELTYGGDTKLSNVNPIVKERDPKKCFCLGQDGPISMKCHFHPTNSTYIWLLVCNLTFW